MLSRVVAVLVLSMPLVAWAQDIGFRDAHATVELSAWDAGRLRMYLESAATACTLSTKQSLDGEYAIALQIDAKGKARTVDVRGGSRMVRCLKGMLGKVGFPEAGQRYRWNGVLRVGITPGPGIAVLRFEPLSALHRGTLRNAIVARLEALPACAREALRDGVSVALHATLRAEADGVLAPPKVELSTHATDALAPCLAEHLASLRFPPSHTYTEVKMFFHLRQPTDDVPADVPTVKLKEAR